ncbi:MAG: ribbon-helix-helix domain-containing protein [Planctomycetota bacterium]|jgi:metal-responsive CopG/Arc/MetJ family transcriptional regulator
MKEKIIMSDKTGTKRINVSLARRTIEFIDSIWPKKQFKSRSAFLDEATRFYAHAWKEQQSSVC